LNPVFRVSGQIGESIEIHLGLKGKERDEKIIEVLKLVGITDENLIEDVYCCNEPKLHRVLFNGILTGQCGEANLEDKEPCNLAELAINNLSSKEEALDLAVLLYKTQKAIASLNYYHKETNEVVHRNYKLGLSITGVCQKLDVIEEWTDYIYKGLRKCDKEWSKKNNYPESIRLTVIQPSGTKGLLLGSSPGGHPGFSEYFIAFKLR